MFEDVSFSAAVGTRGLGHVPAKREKSSLLMTRALVLLPVLLAGVKVALSSHRCWTRSVGAARRQKKTHNHTEEGRKY